MPTQALDVTIKAKSNKEQPLIAPVIVDKPDSGQQPEPQDAVLCGNCYQVITHASEQLTIQGAHQHAFANPQGILFEIACYKSAKGCLYSGVPTSEWSWFRGFRWRFATCGKCGHQLGWLFVSNAEFSFNGLIINRLIIPAGPS